MSPSRPAAVIVLAAGEGTRMRSATPKVLHQLLDRSLLGHVIAAVDGLSPEHLLVVVGHGRDAVTEHLTEIAPHAQPVLQAEQRGTGHAVRLALENIPEASGAVLVVPGDAPLLTTATLAALLTRHAEAAATTTLLTAVVPDPTGYGRVVRDPDGGVARIVEERDANDAEQAIGEVGTSVYVFLADALRSAVGKLSTDNAKGEEYLTDVIEQQVSAGQIVAAHPAVDWHETVGVNDRVQLAAAAAYLRNRINRAHMRLGVTIDDPATTWIGTGVTLEPDVLIHPNTRLFGTTRVSADAEIGPDTTLVDTRVGAGARVRNSTCDRAEIGPQADVGPYTYLRPGTRLGPRSKAGAYVEIKAAEVGADSKVPHLSYVGDATIGERTNIGAATVFVNYDGQDKHRSTVGDDVRIGSDTMVVAPVDVGDGAYTAAGSVITEDVPAGAMGVARARQRNVEGWVERRRPGTPAAEAAARARRNDEPAEMRDETGVEQGAGE
ncbi:MAG: bifunctional UDP-N-acetylglucosamine diphosphorylase/glucosamine-1-phosphate N-acetyltransferase GlmU [Actinomycetes bacterium]